MRLLLAGCMALLCGAAHGAETSAASFERHLMLSERESVSLVVDLSAAVVGPAPDDVAQASTAASQTNTSDAACQACAPASDAIGAADGANGASGLFSLDRSAGADDQQATATSIVGLGSVPVPQ